MSTDVSSQPSLDELCSVIGEAIDLPADRVRSCGALVAGLGLDELSLAAVILAVERLNPWFQLPDQVDVHEVTVADLHHFACVMSPGHAEEGRSDDHEQG